MFNACNILRDCVVLTLTAVMFIAGAANAQPLPSLSRGPLARLVKTPDASAGLPPFALADQFGTIQRYVEPVAGIDLEPYVDQVVSVRHDTGQTLLASQLELPSQRLYPMVGEFAATGTGRADGRFASLATDEMHSDPGVRQAQYVDSDDTTVELLDEGEAIPQGSGPMYQGGAPGGAIYPDGYPVFPGEPPPGTQPMNAGPVYFDPMYGGPQPAGQYPAEYGMNPQYGGYYDPSYPQNMGYVQPFDNKPKRERAHIYGDVEINFLRLHMMEEQIGKLSEKYDFSPRFILGFTGVGNLDGRARYWLYGRETQALNDDSVRVEFDVLDLEATHYFSGRRSQLVLGAGPRLARIELSDDDDEDAGCDLIGITFAADGLTSLIKSDGGHVGWVYGGRLSILGGDWGGEDDSDFVDERIRDDNVIAHELYAGIEFARRYRNLDLHARLAFEMQNWHSDVLSESADIESIGFVGPGVRIGAEF